MDIEVLYNIATEVKSNDNEIKTDFQHDVLEWWMLTFLETFLEEYKHLVKDKEMKKLVTEIYLSEDEFEDKVSYILFFLNVIVVS